MNNYSQRHLVGVAGFRGYSGAELVRLLESHPGVEPVLLEHRSDPDEGTTPLGRRPRRTISATAEAIRQEGLAVVLLATPAEVSMQLAPAILETGTKVIDLSGAFRLRRCRELFAMVWRAAYETGLATQGSVRPAGVLSGADCAGRSWWQIRAVTRRRRTWPSGRW